MKSITIKDGDGFILLKIKRTKDGVESKAWSRVGPLKICCVLEDNSRIFLFPNHHQTNG